MPPAHFRVSPLSPLESGYCVLKDAAYMYRAREQLPHKGAQASGRFKTIRRINRGGKGYY